MRKTKHVLFSFPPYMYKAVERYLNDQAAKGWELEKVGRFGYLAKFRRTHRTDLRYCTDLISYRRGKKGRAEVEEYLALCREGGWELVDRRDNIGVFLAKLGAAPAPIQTDPEVERAHYRQVRLNGLFWVMISLLIDLIYWLFLLWTGWQTGGEEWISGIPEHLLFSWYHNWMIVALGVILPLLALPALLRLGGLLWSWVRSRRDQAIPTPARWAMWTGAAVNTAVMVLLLILLAAGVVEVIKVKNIALFIGSFIGSMYLLGHSLTVERMTSHPWEASQMRTKGIVVGAFSAAAIVLTIVVGGGGEQTGIGPAGWYDQVRFPLDQVEDEPRQGVSATRYDCWNEELAEQVVDTRCLEAVTPERVMYRGMTVWDYRCDELIPLDLSWADEAWLGNWTNDGWGEEQGQVLVARKGCVVMWMSDGMELTRPDVLRAFQEQLSD